MWWFPASYLKAALDFQGLLVVPSFPPLYLSIARPGCTFIARKDGRSDTRIEVGDWCYKGDLED